MICPNCGRVIKDGAKFCGSCGFRIPLPEEEPKEAVEPILVNDNGSSVKRRSSKTWLIIGLILVVACVGALLAHTHFGTPYNGVYMGNSSMNISHGGCATAQDDEIYYVNGSEIFRSINGDQMSIMKFEDQNYSGDYKYNCRISDINVKDGWLYFIVWDTKAGFSDGIWEIRTDGSELSKLLPGYPTDNNGRRAWQHDLFLVEDRLIYSDCFDEYGSLLRGRTMISSVDLNGEDRKTVYTSEDILAWTTDGEYLYCLNTDASLERRKLFEEGEWEVIADCKSAESVEEDSYRIFVHDGDVYLESVMGDYLYRIDKKDRELTLVANEADDNKYLNKAFVLDGDDIYLIKGCWGQVADGGLSEEDINAAGIYKYIDDGDLQLVTKLDVKDLDDEYPYTEYPWLIKNCPFWSCIVNRHIFIPLYTLLWMPDYDHDSYVKEAQFLFDTDLSNNSCEITATDIWDSVHGDYDI